LSSNFVKKRLYSDENAKPAIKLSTAAYMVLTIIPGIQLIIPCPILWIMDKPPLGCISSNNFTSSAANPVEEHQIKRIMEGTVPMIRVVMENHFILSFIILPHRII